MNEKKSDLIPRIITAAVAIPLLAILIFMGPAWGFWILVVAAASVNAWEFCSMAYQKSHQAAKVVTSAFTVGLVSVMYFAFEYFFFATVAAVLGIFLFFLVTFRDKDKVSERIAASITAIFYGGVTMGTIALLRRDPGDSGSLWILLLLLVVWGSDSGAYFTGRAMGKHKLAPRVSPNKSVEGALGGLAASLVAAFACNAIYPMVSAAWEPLPWTWILLLTIPANLLGQAGDLCESLIKRSYGVKDSGTIIYGHGGLLDRIDALLFAGPWFYFFFSLVVDAAATAP